MAVYSRAALPRLVPHRQSKMLVHYSTLVASERKESESWTIELSQLDSTSGEYAEASLLPLTHDALNHRFLRVHTHLLREYRYQR